MSARISLEGSTIKLTHTKLALGHLTALSLAPTASDGVLSGYLDDDISPEEKAAMLMTKNPPFGCCSVWVALTRDAGGVMCMSHSNDVTGAKMEDLILGPVWSRHTHCARGEVVEGHVPVAGLEQLLGKRPEITLGGTAGDGAIFHRVGK